jgi:hypothetical protein
MRNNNMEKSETALFLRDRDHNTAFAFVSANSIVHTMNLAIGVRAMLAITIEGDEDAMVLGSSPGGG